MAQEQAPSPPDASPDGARKGPPWFADELGRALTRAVESGVRGNTLRRDLDRLLNLFESGIQVFAPCGTGNPVLTDEVQTLIKHLTEVALGVRQCDDWQRDWFVAPALRLARIERRLEDVAVCSTGWPGRADTLARTALVGWLLAADALIGVQPEIGRDAGGPGPDPWPARNGRRWNQHGTSRSSPARYATTACASGSRTPGIRSSAQRGFRGQRPLVRLDTVSADGGGRR